ncbi:MAG TPA: NAD(P)-binding protein [archaeon]|nr:NAD(P)-binding protein [archaeon]
MNRRVQITGLKNLPPVSISLDDMRWNKTGNWTFFAPVYRDKLSPCSLDCPLAVPIGKYMHLVKEGKYRKAWEMLVEANPLPAVTGRVCYHTCELRCNRLEMDQAVNIHSIERFLGDAAIAEGWTIEPPAEEIEGPPVVIVGSGPAGLGCAYGLRKKGYPVTVYEQETRPGGMLRVGVPEFRMPRSLLDAEIKRLESIGIRFRCGEKVEDYAEIARGVRALFLATGAHGSRDPQVEGLDLDGVYFGLDFLKAFNTGLTPRLGRQVAVVGGGNTAIDVTRAALRLGANVNLYYRRTREEMPAHPEEVEQALAEGATLHFQVAPTTVMAGGDSRAAALKLVRMRKGAVDDSGRARPVVVKGSEFNVEAETVVFAVGEAPELEYLNGQGQREGSRLAVDPCLRTSLPDIFAGGDIIPGENSVSHALADGLAAARNMHLLFTGADPVPVTLEKGKPVEFGGINTDYFKPAPRLEAELKVEKNPRDSQEVQGALTREETAAESSRCFNCGVCVDCDNCLIFCPDMAIYTVDDVYMVKTEYCKGCGICAEECPRSVIKMERKS